MKRGFLAARRSVALAGLLAIGVASPALADRAFTPRFSTNANGDIAIVGNTLETCQTSVADCANARAGIGSVLNNNNFSMVRANTDSATLDSSSARLSLPAGARVLFAGLYYGSRTTAGTGGKAAPDTSVAGLSKVDFKPPGASAFEHLTTAVDLSTEVTGAYAAFVNVTGHVQRAGSGVYTVANVQSATGEDRYAGWALVVAYEAAGEPPRNLSVFDGLQSVTQGKPAVTIPVSGFQTPLSGPVRTKLGFVAYEGDRGLTGDSATLDGKVLSDKVNAANNFFNSAISTNGQNFTDKTPDYVNQLGFDAKLIGIDGLLANGATSATIGLKTSSDQYLPHVITFATDLYAPVIRATKTVANLTHPDGPTRAGDRLRYTVTFANEGLEAATNFVATDKIPPNATYVAGSLRIPSAPGGAATPSDLGSDDQGEYDAAQSTVRFFLGSGAAAGRGGTIAVAGSPGDTAQISFEVRVDDNLTAEHEIRNTAQATFIAPTLGKELTALSSEALVSATPAPTPTEPADLGLAQSETVAPAASGNDAVDDHVTIENNGPGDATDVVLRDVVPPGATIDSVTIDQGSCTVSATDVTCVISHLDAGGSAVADIVLVEPAGDARAGSTSEASISASQFDPTPSNDSGNATAPMPVPGAPMADLVIEDHESSSQDTLGGTLTDTITVVNNGPGAATGVDLTDAMDAAAQVIAVEPGAFTCSSGADIQCSLAELAPGASETLEVHVRPLRPGRLIDDVTASDDELDPNYANDSAKAIATVRPRRTSARVRIVPLQPVATPGHVVGFVVTIGAIKPIPGVMPRVCVTVPSQLRVTTAPGAVASGGRLCWGTDALISGAPRTFRFSARIVSPSTVSATALAVHARLTGANFSASSAAATVQVPPRAVVACPSSSGSAPPGRIAC
jgi:large repetitive protein